MRLLLVTALLFPLLAIAAADKLAMGPDPGGHTGATVTPESTRTDNSAVDAARQSASDNKTDTEQSADKNKK